MPDGIFPETAVLQITQRHIPSFIRIKQLVFEEFLCERINNVQAVGELLFGLLLGAAFGFFNRHIVLCRQPAQGFSIAILLMLHQEPHRITATATTKTFVDFLGRTYGE